MDDVSDGLRVRLEQVLAVASQSPERDRLLADLVEEVEFRQKQLLLLHRVDQRVLDNSHTLADTLSYIVAEVKSALDAQHVDILFAYEDGLRIEISSDPEEEKRPVPIEQSISGLAMTRSEPILENDLQANDTLRVRYFPRSQGRQPDSSARLGVIAARIEFGGRPIGVINVESSAGHTFAPVHVGFVASVAAQVSMAIMHAALFDEDQLRTAVDALLLENTDADNEYVLHQVLRRILTTLKSFGFIDADAAEILFVDPQEPDFLVVAHSTNTSDIGVRVGVEDSICGRAFTRLETIVLPRAVESELFKPVQTGMLSEMAIPIQLGGNERFSIGVLNLESARENAFSGVARVLAERFARRVVNILALTKLRSDLDAVVQDQFLLLAADHVLNAVHRINNDVGAARALAQALLYDLDHDLVPEPGEVRRTLQQIVDSTSRGLAIPGELRRRIGGPQQSIDVNDRVREGLDNIHAPQNVTIAMSLADGLPDLPCTALDLVVENLVLNAIEALSGKGGGEVRVSTYLDARPAGHAFVVLSISDDGVGMTDSQLESLFERRGGHTRGRGLGFGLPWVKTWVRRAHGLIDVVSVVGKGTTVTIRFQIDAETGALVVPHGEEAR